MATGSLDFRYVATHICDSMKRRIKTAGAARVQGEFGIGLLSFWTVGEALSMSSTGSDGRVYEMQMAKGKQSYTVRTRPLLGAERGTRLRIKPLLPGIRQLSGEKMQWYLASELRERIRAAGVQVKIVDRQARKEFAVEPRQFSGRLLHHLPVVATRTARCMSNSIWTKRTQRIVSASTGMERVSCPRSRTSRRSRAALGRTVTCKGSWTHHSSI